MESDAQRARASFMTRASDMRENLFFAHPVQKMQAIQLYCCDAYGSMLWQFGCNYSESFFKAWNVQSRLAWGVPRETHTNIVENYLCDGFRSMRKQVYTRFHSFTLNLAKSPSREVRFLFNLVKKDCRSVTGSNLMFLRDFLSCDDTLKYAKCRIEEMFPKLEQLGPWRESLMDTLLNARQARNYHDLNLTKDSLDDMIRSLCIS